MNNLFIGIFVFLICIPSINEGRGLRFYKNRLNADADDVAPIPNAHHAVAKNDLIFISAQKGIVVPVLRLNKRCECTGGTKFEREAENALEHVMKSVEAGEGTRHDVVFMTVYVLNISYVSQLRGVFCKVFENYPAITAIEVSDLPDASQLVIDAIAVIDPPKRRVKIAKNHPDSSQPELPHRPHHWHH